MEYLTFSYTGEHTLGTKKMEENCNAISEVMQEMKVHKQKETMSELELSDEAC